MRRVSEDTKYTCKNMRSKKWNSIFLILASGPFIHSEQYPSSRKASLGLSSLYKNVHDKYAFPINSIPRPHVFAKPPDSYPYQIIVAVYRRNRWTRRACISNKLWGTAGGWSLCSASVPRSYMRYNLWRDGMLYTTDNCDDWSLPSIVLRKCLLWVHHPLWV